MTSAANKTPHETSHKTTQWSDLKPSDVLRPAEMRILRQRRNSVGYWLIAHCWGVILAAWALYGLFPSAITLVLAVIIIGGRQLGLAVLMHEGSHCLLFRDQKLGDLVTNLFCAWPVVISLTEYRKRHMAHHRYIRTERDPENDLYTPFPVSRASMIRKCLRDLTGLTFLRSQLGLFRAVRGQNDGKRLTRLFAFYRGPLAVNTGMALLFAGFGRFDLFLLLWVLPLATTHMLFLRIRNIAEHAAVDDLSDPLRNSRTILAGFLERATVAPYWVNYHIEHHLLPFIPCHRLPSVHRLLKERGYLGRMEVRHSYAEVLGLMVSDPPSGATPV